MDTPLIALIGSPPWADEATRLAASAGCRLVDFAERSGYLARLADEQVALILVDGQYPDWQHFTTSPKVNAATRRIPVVVVSSDDDQTLEAYAAGADLVLSPAELSARLGRVIADYARIQPEDVVARLADQCAEPLPERAHEGIEQFNIGEYYHQHDSFEELWLEESGPVRELYRAILQVGIAYFQVTRHNPRGAHKMILRSIQWLNILPDVCQGVDVVRLRVDAMRLRDYLESLPEGAELAEYPDDLLGKVHLLES
jgi:CheY-like chemotaxis protein